MDHFNDILHNLDDILQIVLYIAIGLLIVAGKKRAERKRGKARRAAKRRDIEILTEPVEVPPMPETVWTQTATSPKRPAKAKKEPAKRYFTYENAEDFAKAERASRASSEAAGKPAKTDKKQGSEHQSTREFNLREAVIFSEILKPKFDE